MVDSKENYKFDLGVKGLKEREIRKVYISPILLNFLNNIHIKLQNANMLCIVKLLNSNFLLFFLVNYFSQRETNDINLLK